MSKSEAKLHLIQGGSNQLVKELTWLNPHLLPQTPKYEGRVAKDGNIVDLSKFSLDKQFKIEGELNLSSSITLDKEVLTSMRDQI